MKKLLILISMFILLSLGVSAANLTWSDNSSTMTNETSYGDSIDFQASCTGLNPPKVYNMLFSWNGTNGDALANDTKVFKNTTSATLIASKDLGISAGQFCWRFWANDTNGKWSSSELWCDNIFIDPYDLSWTNNFTAGLNNDSGLHPYTRRYDNITFNVTFKTNNPSLTNVSSIRFSWNGTNGGTFANESASTSVVPSYDFGIFKTINTAAGNKFCWKFWANDSNNLWYVTDTWCHSMYNFPTITMNIPSANTNLSTTSIAPNITVSGAASNYLCWFYSNDSGVMAIEGESISLANGVSGKFANQTVSEGSVKWNVKCQETGDSSRWSWGTNTTFTADKTTPVVSLNKIIDGESVLLSPTKHYLRTFNFTLNLSVTESNLKNCSLYFSTSLNLTATLNQSNVSSPSSGNSVKTFSRTDLSNTSGVYNFYVTCSDYVGRKGTSDTYYFTVDRVAPKILKWTNYSLQSCSLQGLNFSASEILDNSTVYYGNTTNPNMTNTYSTDGLNRLHSISFGDEWEKSYNYNVTLYDLAGNTNYTTVLFTHYTPVPMCSGWNIYTIYAAQTISALKTAANSSYVYIWNYTSQSWVYGDSDTAAIGDAAYFYAPSDTTWLRPGTGADITYTRNVMSGHNYFGIGYSSNFGALSTRQFRNISGNVTSEGLQFRIDYFASWNNTGKNWVSAQFGKSWRNTTTLGRTVSNGLDTVWAWSDYNISVRINSTGYVYGNWS